MARHFLFSRALLLTAALACSTHSTPESGAEPARPSSVSQRLTRLEVPPGHIPPAGTCRVWFPGQPPGRQPKAGACASVERTAPAGSWILYRPTADRRVVHVREVDARRAGIVVNVRVFDAASGAYLRDVRP
jgi:hypothetical protein